jgi:HSP20 family molecular chaperone IbpA
MWVEACEMLDRAERLHRQLFQLHRLSQRRPNWEPPVDVFETERELKVVVLLPGVTAELVAVTIEGSQLIIAGERRLPISGPATIHRLEIPYGRFEKRMQLTSRRYEITGSELANGCLILNLRKLS